MKNVLKIILFTLLVTAFYGYVGQMVPQKEVHPPKDLVVGPEMTTEELVLAGKQIAEGKGTCMGCHTIGSQEKGRFPDLGGIGSRAATRRPGLTAVDYLAESLYEPNAFIVDGYSPGMPPIGKPPIGLSDAEMLAVIAYLQSLGGEPTVTGTTRLKYASSSPATSGQPAAQPAVQPAELPSEKPAAAPAPGATSPAEAAASPGWRLQGSR